MKLDEAMLLPNVYKEFKSEVFANISQFPHSKSSLRMNYLIVIRYSPNSMCILKTKSLYSADTRYGVVMSLRLFTQHLERPIHIQRIGQVMKASNVLHVHVQVHVLAPP